MDFHKRSASKKQVRRSTGLFCGAIDERRRAGWLYSLPVWAVNAFLLIFSRPTLLEVTGVRGYKRSVTIAALKPCCARYAALV